MISHYVNNLVSTKRVISDFKAHINDANKSDRTDEVGFYTWGNCVVKHTDGLYYSFMNRWEDTDGFVGWVHYNNIYVSQGASVSTGPFTGYEAISSLKGQSWCADMVTNQNVVYHNGTYYLFFVGTNYTTISYPPVDSEARANQQIGVATSNHPLGPWVLEGTNPVLYPRPGKWDQNIVNNPSVYMDINGTWRMVYKSDYYTNKGMLRVGVATSNDLINWGGRTDEPNFNLNGEAEDPYVWREGNKWYAIAKAFDGSVVTFGNGIFLESVDGIDFELASNQPAWDRVINWTDETSDSYTHEERPFVLVENGIGHTYYASILGGSYNSFNIGRMLKFRE